MPCQIAKNINVATWDNVLLPKNRSRLKKYLKEQIMSEPKQSILITS